MAPVKHSAHHSSKTHAEPAYVQIFIQQCLPAAQQVKAKWRVPIAVLIAQGAVESFWGQRVIDNAYFGVKGKLADGDTVVFATREHLDGKDIKEPQRFRAYKDLAEAADDYGRFLNVNPRFKAAFLYTNDPLRFVQEVDKAHYASDIHYGETVSSIIRSHHLDQYDK